jgi:hypothetical protein
VVNNGSGNDEWYSWYENGCGWLIVEKITYMRTMVLVYLPTKLADF